MFPGEQGGPHVNSIAALAVSLKLAKTPQFHDLQVQTVNNAKRLADQLASHGLRIVHGGTDTHLLLVDTKSVMGADGTPLSGDMAARILDLVGITCNRNTIPGDLIANRPTGIRLGTPWITQRGFAEPQIDRLAAIIASVLKACKPFSYDGKGGKADLRAKIGFEAYAQASHEVAELCDQAGLDYTLPVVGDEMPVEGRSHLAVWAGEGDATSPRAISIRGEKAGEFLSIALTSAVTLLADGERQPTLILEADGAVIAPGIVERQAADQYTVYAAHFGPLIASWLRALSDGFVIHDPTDVYGKLPGPVVVDLLSTPVSDELADELNSIEVADGLYYLNKPYFVGCHGSEYSGPARGGAARFRLAAPRRCAAQANVHLRAASADGRENGAIRRL